MALAVSMGFLILFVAFAALGERALQENAARVLDERLVITQMVAGQIDGILKEAKSRLEEVRHLADFDPGDPDLSTEAEVMEHTFGSIGLFSSGGVFLNPSGQVVLSYPHNLYAIGTDLSALHQTTQARSQGHVVISQAYHEPLGKEPIVAVTVPIHNEESGELLGFLSGLLSLEETGIIEPLQRAAFLGHTAHAVLVDVQGRALLSTFDLPFLSPGEHHTFYQAAMAEGEPTVKTVPFELDLPNEPPGHLHVMAFVPLNNAPWGVAVGGDVGSETFAGLQRLRRGLVVLGITAFIGVWLITLIGTRKLANPIQQLTYKARKIASGELDIPLSRPEGGEIGIMAEALEDMRKQLLANIRELAEVNNSLERRVAEQTDGLRQQQMLTQELLHQVITAQEKERKRLAHELHDEIGQVLTAIEISLSRVEAIVPLENEDAVDRLEKSKLLTQKAVDELRRIVAALRPGILDELGLLPALNWLSEHTLKAMGISVTIDSEALPERLPGEIETILFRIAQEAMNNVARYSQAANVYINLRMNRDKLKLTIADDGKGFEQSSSASSPGYHHGLGLGSMQERAALTGGEVSLESTLGQGTTVHVLIPIPEIMMRGPHHD